MGHNPKDHPGKFWIGQGGRAGEQPEIAFKYFLIPRFSDISTANMKI